MPLQEVGLDPSALIGGLIAGLRSTASCACLALGEETVLIASGVTPAGRRPACGQDQCPGHMGTWPCRCNINISIFSFYLILLQVYVVCGYSPILQMKKLRFY